jgi:hypothetical protein
MQNTNQITDQIINVFEQYRMAPLPVGDQYQEAGRPKLAVKLQPFVAANKPVDFVMLGYPMKSPIYTV